MDRLTTTPGLIHIAENIFSNLERRDLLQCQEVNESWARILRNPWFWYNRLKKNNSHVGKMKGMSCKRQLTLSQCADGESNKIVWDKKETVTA